MKIAVGTALLSLVVATDGYHMITCAAMLPLYKRIGMNPMILATIAANLTSQGGMTPWRPRRERSQRWAWTPVLAIALAADHDWRRDVGGVHAFLLGRAERKRIGGVQLQSGGGNCYIEAIARTHAVQTPETGLPHQPVAGDRGDGCPGHGHHAFGDVPDPGSCWR